VRTFKYLLCSAPGSPDEVERVAEEGERGGHAEDGHAESAGWSQNGSRSTGKSFVRYERYQNEVSLVLITYSHTIQVQTFGKSKTIAHVIHGFDFGSDTYTSVCS
jgi:hypothetical protein